MLELLQLFEKWRENFFRLLHLLESLDIGVK